MLLSVAEPLNTPVTGHGAVVAGAGALALVDGVAAGGGTTGEVIVDRGGIGLSPRLLISVDPRGMPARPGCKAG